MNLDLVSETVPLGSGKIVGIDTTTRLTTSSVQALARSNVAYVMRYVDIALGGQNSATLSAAELAEIAGAGMPVMAIQFARVAGWSSATGKSDGAAAARNALAVGLPLEATLTCDLESTGNLQTSQAEDYANAWYASATSEGATDLQIYIGAGVPLTSSELYHSLRFRGYWRSGSLVPEVDVRGYRMVQLDPLDQIVAGVQVDLSVVQTDRLGGRPRWARAA